MNPPENAEVRDKLAWRLKVSGPQTVAQLADWLGLTLVGARRHLLQMEASGDVKKEDRRQGVGRPAQVWRLTGSGHRGFADRHADLALRLIAGITSVYGCDGLSQVLNAMSVADRQRLGPLLEGLPLLEQVQEVARARTAQGYMAEATHGEDGAVILTEHHCPVSSAAAQCDGLCEQELLAFQELFGDSCSVERVSHIQAGDVRCSYRIGSKGSTDQPGTEDDGPSLWV